MRFVRADDPNDPNGLYPSFAREDFEAEAAGPHPSVGERPNLVGSPAVFGFQLVGLLSKLDEPPAVLLEAAHRSAYWMTALWRVAGRESTGWTVTIDGEDVELPAIPGHSIAKHENWSVGWGLAWSLRSTELADALLASRYEETPPGPGVTRGPATARWMGVLPGVHLDDNLWVPRCEEGMILTAQGAVDEESWPQVRLLHHTFRALLALREPARFDAELYALLEAYEARLALYGTVGSVEAAIAWLPLGIAALAHDRGIRVGVESEYIPGWWIRGEWP